MSHYTLEFLIKTFSEHSLKFREGQKKLIRDFKENNPNDPLPDYSLDDFDLPKALVSICEEISNLKLLQKEKGGS
jgi:hypothetical protein